MTNEPCREVIKQMIEGKREEIVDALDMVSFFTHLLEDEEYWIRWEKRNK